MEMRWLWLTSIPMHDAGKRQSTTYGFFIAIAKSDVVLRSLSSRVRMTKRQQIEEPDDGKLSRPVL
jgi:hypothetical protein